MSNFKRYDFSGKVALVTGSSSNGIGAAIALQLAQYGAQVVITGRNAANLNKVAQKIKDASGSTPLEVVGDLLDDSFAPKLVQSAIDKFGRIDVLVNNAGFGDTDMSLSSENLMEGYDKVMGLNLKSAIRMTQLCVPHLEKGKGFSNIINISSIAAIRPYVLVYSCSKAALDMCTRCSASELGVKGIRVNSINPGPIWTDFGRSVGNDRFFHDLEHIVKAKSPLGRIGDPEEIANLASFLASDLAANITGSIFVSDGGMLVESMGK
ncbi:PREDICTED: uncharacterized oxidoreductase MexAM1_META1p0182-like [Rhagoletis zephyria]|uniref:uncharacterized oxidoreductase MexAM1_META1p0182-like n=1 Tax=Rhagoletis zephyria TaxID=28612 RepID=UPI0008112B6F|nr:PREDICTED: uncharacterized oxidoreductase MexAM1_META1p0182-like [Rhagoletis zephyria]